MALIECKDCGNKISDSAAACIHCGRPNDPLASSKRFSEPIRSIPERQGVHSLACPKCGSEQTVNASLLQMRETASVALGSVGAGYGRMMGGSVNASVTQGQIQSNLAASLAPPQRRSQNFRLAGFLLFIAAVLMGSSDSAVVGIIALGGVLFYVIKQQISINQWNQTEYLEQYEQWERKYLCQRCGNIFVGPPKS